MTDCIFPKTNSNTLSAADVDVLYIVREGLIDLAAEQTTANACLYKIRRDKMVRTCNAATIGTQNATCLTSSTSIHTDKYFSNACHSVNTTYLCTCTVSGGSGCVSCTAGNTIYGNATYADLYINACGCLCAGTQANVCLTLTACSSSNDIAPQNYDEVYIVWRGSLGSSNAAAPQNSCLTTFGAAVGTSLNCTCEVCILWKKVSGNIYDIYCNGTCVCQVADITTYTIHAFVQGGTTCSGGTVCGDGRAYLYMIRRCTSALASATCITTCNFAHCTCPKSIYVGGLKTGTGCVVYNVYDAANNCTLASAKPFNSPTCLCGNQCAQCLRVQLIQCNNAVSKIEKWGYVIE